VSGSSSAPWILGARGAPLDAPENTAAGVAAALALGLDGVAVDLRACRSGEIVVAADAQLERTTDGHGIVAEKDWIDLAGLDAGGWFQARFRGERLLLAEELLALCEAHGPATNLVALAHGADFVARFADLARELAPRAGLRLAGAERETVLAARDAGLAALVVAEALDERLLARVREDRPAGVAAPVAAWRSPEAREDWPVERWAFDVDDPADLLSACRLGLHAVTTREPRRALAARTVARLAPEFEGAWPIEVPDLEVAPEPGSLLAGDWSGSWSVRVRVANPFAFAVKATVAIGVRRGAFDVEGLPRALDLAPRASADVDLVLTGGARRPGGDPLLVVRYAWRAGPGRAAGHVDVDAPFRRRRTAIADAIPRRLFLLRDGPNDMPATLVLRRRARDLTVALEARGSLVDPHVVVRCAGRTYQGARGVRVPLPADFDARSEGLPFTCGLVAWREGERVWRHWAGGLGDGPDAGAPGVLRPGASA